MKAWVLHAVTIQQETPDDFAFIPRSRLADRFRDYPLHDPSLGRETYAVACHNRQVSAGLQRIRKAQARPRQALCPRDADSSAHPDRVGTVATRPTDPFLLCRTADRPRPATRPGSRTTRGRFARAPYDSGEILISAKLL